MRIAGLRTLASHLSGKPAKYDRILRLANDLLEGWPASRLYLADELAHGCDGADVGHSLFPPGQASRGIAQNMPDKHARSVDRKRGDVLVKRLLLRIAEVGFDVGNIKHTHCCFALGKVAADIADHGRPCEIAH